MALSGGLRAPRTCTCSLFRTIFLTGKSLDEEFLSVDYPFLGYLLLAKPPVGPFLTGGKPKCEA